MIEEGKSRITVRSNNVLQPPLLDTTEASIIEFRDRFGALNALFCRVLSDDMWGLVTKNDPDWDATLIRYGYHRLDRPLDEVIRHGL
jgi:hypothetical protein